MSKIETLRSLNKILPTMLAKEFVTQHSEELSQFPTFAPYVNGVLNGKTNVAIRSAFQSIAILIREELDKEIKAASKPRPAKPTPAAPKLAEGLVIKVCPSQPGDREHDRANRKEFWDTAKGIGKVLKKQARAAKTTQSENKLVAKKVEKPVTVRKPLPEVRVNYIPKSKQAAARMAFFADVVRIKQTSIGGITESTSVLNKSDFKQFPRLLLQDGFDPAEVVTKHRDIIGTNPQTYRYLQQYEHGLMSSYVLLDRARQVLLAEHQAAGTKGLPPVVQQAGYNVLTRALDVRNWRRLPIPGVPDAKRRQRMEEYSRECEKAEEAAKNGTSADTSPYGFTKGGRWHPIVVTAQVS